MLQLPTAIESRRLRFLFDTKSGATPSSGVEEYWDGDINWVTPEDLGKLDGRYVKDTRRRISEEGYKNCGVSLAPANALVLSKRAPIGQVAILSVDATCNQGCFLLTKQNGVDERFYYYALLHLRPLLEILGRGSTFMELSADDLRSVRLPFPPEQTQRLIADYLDRETARIDALVAEKEKMLALLEEKRAALISRAVTRGLDPDVPLKPSGLDWLGDIPAHWEVLPLRWFMRIGSGEFLPNEAISKDETEEMPIPVVGGNGVLGYTSQANTENALVIGRVGAQCGNVHFIDGPLWVTDNALLVKLTSRFEPRYLREVLHLMELNTLANQSAQPLITGEMVKAQKVPAPLVPEQEDILRLLNDALSEYVALLNEAEKSLRLLKERRAALITAAVTGRIPVEEMGG
jgi:type I restriction enzyme S subunit